MEVALLAKFPNATVLWRGVMKKSYKHQVFLERLIWGQKENYLITLDPIDGTRYYMDGHA